MPQGRPQAILCTAAASAGIVRACATAPPQKLARFPRAKRFLGDFKMRRLIVVIVLAVAALAPTAFAQTATPDSENGRYTFNKVADGMLRLDTRTGQVSLCANQAAGWACNTVPDERQALENEIARLQRENGALKKDMLARNLPLPGGVATAPSAEPQRELKLPLPSDAEIDRVMSAFEKMWRRLVDMVQKTPSSDRI
jgi:hypothetical protein